MLAQVLATQNMNVKMENRLASICARIYHNTVARFVDAFDLGDFRHTSHQLTQKICWNTIIE